MKLLAALFLAALAVCTPKRHEPGAAQLEAGKRAFQKCYSCHSLEPGEGDLTGPTLSGIVGRPIAAVPGFDYSQGMRRLAAREQRWTPELLDRLVADPEALAPGTSMAFYGIADPDERAALIAYLEAGQTSASAASRP